MDADIATLLDGLRREHLDLNVPVARTLPCSFEDTCFCGADAHNARLDALRVALDADRERAVADMREACRVLIEQWSVLRGVDVREPDAAIRALPLATKEGA